MSGMDAAFLYGETPSWHMHVSAVLFADPTGDAGGFRVDLLKELLVERIAHAPQFRWKYVEVPFGLDRPCWTEDRDFDIERHVREVTVDAPGGRDEVEALVGDLMAQKIDRHHPLWEIWVIHGLDGGRVAILAKVHHAIIDGVSGAELATVLLDLQPEPARAPRAVLDTLAHERTPSAAELLARGVVHQAVTPWRWARFGGQLARQGLTAAGFLGRRDAPKIPFQAPWTPWNGPIGPHRRFAAGRVPVDRVRALKDAFGVKVNDVVLALVGGALRRYLDELDVLPETPLVAQVPVSLRSGEGEGVGNKVGYMFASLATHIEDPATRVRSIHESTRRAKEMRDALSAQQIMNLSDQTAPGIVALAARTYTAAGLQSVVPPLFNVIVSNVPGPPFPLYIAGAEVEALYPMGPLLFGGGLNVTVISYRGSLDIGLVSCRDRLPDPDRIADAFPDVLDELEAAAPAAS